MSTMIRTARRNTSLPSICMVPPMLAVEEPLGGAVGVEIPAEQLAGPVDGLEHDGAGAVGEQDRRVAVVPVGDRGRACRCRSAAPSRDAHRDQPVGHDEAVHEPAARRVHVERAAAHAERALHRRRRRRHGAVGGGRGEDQRVDVARRRARPCRARRARCRSTARRSCRRRGARWMPVRSTIHSSVVSRYWARSSLVMVFGGRAVPHPVMTAPPTPDGIRGMCSLLSWPGQPSAARRWAGEA